MTTVEIIRRTLAELQARERQVAPLMAEIGALRRAIRDVGALLVRLESTRGREWAPAPGTQPARVLALLRGHARGMHIKVIAQEVGMSLTSAASILPRLAQAGYVRRSAPGFYEITDEAPASVAELARIEEPQDGPGG